jgi:hypothetical protein
VVAIVVGVCVAGGLALVVVCILAISLLGTTTSSQFSALGQPSAAVGTGRDYPADVRRAFLTNCTPSASEPVCSCALEEIEDEYTLEQFVDLERQLADRDGQLTPTLQSIVLRCASGG